MARKSLLDLYVVGKEIAIEDTKVWVQKLNPVEHAQAIRHSEAARARVLTCKFDRDSEQYQSLLDVVVTLDKEVLIEILVIAEKDRILPAREAKVADEEKWKSDNYLQGLRDLWAEEMMERLQNDPDDAEAKRVQAQLEHFRDEVQAAVDADLDSFRRSLLTMSDQELIESSMEQRLKNAGDQAWLDEYHRSEVALGTRHADNHREKVFAHRGEADELQALTFIALTSAFRQLTMEPSEGKDSAAAPPSSTSSGPSEPEATAQSSGPEAAAA